MFSSWSSSPENFRLVSGQNHENWVLKVGVVLLAISILHRKCSGWQKDCCISLLLQCMKRHIFLSPLHFRCKIEIANKTTPTLSTQFSWFRPLAHLKFSGNVEPDQKIMRKKFQKFSFSFLYRAGALCKRWQIFIFQTAAISWWIESQSPTGAQKIALETSFQMVKTACLYLLPIDHRSVCLILKGQA